MRSLTHRYNPSTEYRVSLASELHDRIRSRRGASVCGSLSSRRTSAQLQNRRPSIADRVTAAKLHPESSLRTTSSRPAQLSSTRRGRDTPPFRLDTSTSLHHKVYTLRGALRFVVGSVGAGEDEGERREGSRQRERGAPVQRAHGVAGRRRRARREHRHRAAARAARHAPHLRRRPRLHVGFERIAVHGRKEYPLIIDRSFD